VKSERCRFAFKLDRKFMTVNHKRGYPFRRVRRASRIVC